MEKAPRILYCHCNYAQVVPQETKQRVLAALAESGVAFDAVADLCEMSARRDPALKELAAGDAGLRIAACYPRAVRWLFHAAGATLPEQGVGVANMRQTPADAVVQVLLNGGPLPAPGPGITEPAVDAAGAREPAAVTEAVP